MVGGDAQSLCRVCGMCCDGTLFTFVRLDANEAAGARRNALPVIQRDGSDALQQPCTALEGIDCRVYDARPAPCARYECMLLLALKSAEVTLDEARATVDEARRTKDPAFIDRRFRGSWRTR